MTASALAGPAAAAPGSSPSSAPADRSPASSAQGAPAAPTEVAPGEVLVALQPGTDGESTGKQLSGQPGRAVPGRPDLRVLPTATGREAEDASRIARQPGVRWARPNIRFRSTAAPNDPLYRRQWNLQPRSSALGSSNWEPARDTGITGAGVTVAVVDSGVTPGPDLPNVLPGHDFVTGGNDASDRAGHGTHVASTIAEAANNGTGAAGIAPGASILPVRVLDANGDGNDSNVIAGIAYAVDHGAKIINLSLGGPEDGGLCEAIGRATARGVAVVVAAGNDGGPVDYPGRCPGVITVSATGPSGSLAFYSNRGPQITLAAPGGDGGQNGIVQYSVIGGRPGYYMMSGTSMASPHVAGAAALVLQARPSTSVNELRSILMATAKDLGPRGRDDSYGAGVLDIAGAVRAVANRPS